MESIASPWDDSAFPPYLVGVGASAGGLQALEALFRAIPPDTDLSFVVVQHLSITHKSMMDQLLERVTSMPIKMITDGMRPQSSTVHLMQAGTEVVIKNGCFRLTERDTAQRVPLPIDAFFTSLAEAMASRAVGIILSGTGSDGSCGVVRIHEAGGLVLVQDPHYAQFDGMPLNAINTGHTDLVLKPEQMADVLQAYQDNPTTGLHLTETTAKPASPRDRLFALLWDRYDVDFTHYKTATITRRIERRLTLSRDGDLESYVQRLTHDIDALDALYRDLLIGVTQFFRDDEAFEYLEQKVMPQLLQTAAARDLRIWVAGCATGEEAYSIAMLVHEGLERQDAPQSVQIFATDVHQTSLDIASAGLYGEDAVRKMKPERLARYFMVEPGGYRVIPALRQMIVFARHDLTYDVPFGNVDLVTCRNVLIYIQLASQEQILRRFLYGLRVGGTMMLGPSESVGSLHTAFTEVDHCWKVYRKERESQPLSDFVPLPDTQKPSPRPSPKRPGSTPHSLSLARQQLYDKLLEALIPAGVLVNAEGKWEHVVGDLTPFVPPFRGPNDAEVLTLVHPDLRGALHNAFIHATNKRQPVVYQNLSLSTLAPDQRVTLKVTPLDGPSEPSTAFFIEFEVILVEASPIKDQPLQVFGNSQGMVKLLEQELTQTKVVLQATIEELQTRTEELQTTNEEMIASNEELQSSNEELQSVNEELHTINTEYQVKNQQLIDLHSDTENLLRSTDIGTIFLDAQGGIRKYTPAVTTMVPLQPQDIGRPLNHFVTTLDMAQATFLELLQQVYRNQTPQTRKVKTTTGIEFLMRIHPFVTASQEVEGTVVTFVDMTEQNEMQAQLQHYMADNLALEQFAHVVSHDLKAPLRAIHNLAKWICEDEADGLSDASRRDLTLVQQRVEAMEALLESLLQY
ncbi:chemotaxis protein CheB [Candidatus Entotheonella palauensis]|uniref:chemotaxis protein CheB n=1 Tax=Candidatus Entotheonella palauensis TaxID=93172 RepID=UPI0015C42DBF|nr:chemotaxis protein CheB [Candidatus Entotheonella palauensis]